MSPIAHSAVKFTQRIRNSNLRHLTLNLIHEATKQPELAHFTVAKLKNPTHTSHTDSKQHTTVLLATEEQAKTNKSHTVHIYHDEIGNYTGHRIYPERQNKESDG
ncbi:hypothetical protein BU25DRAFT_409864 [Macroventuria anomochaeta]|uniref:Uncharacterized protein n=1 Tax=Macroventuria anomochaeta TaxID=301207 RepID=A0ACB6S6J1_9PLEO|nr:uncharacterized protein BU25DRAFT_409864 [Macroventuria anomochaeta]KAF2628839.1 hypothetical protein BU25DRAFT_409864 [Macroventuria anomochaeta]